jgi:hypothetical protein
MLMHSYAAGGADREIRDHVRRMYGSVVTEVTELSAAGPDDTWSFFATGMLLNIVAALDLHESDHPVFRAWTALPA